MSKRIIAGIDEVGRGPLAGPVVAACVHIPDSTLIWLKDVKDSKKLSKIMRAKLDILIRENCVYSIAEITPQIIDEINILQATMLAMETAASKIKIQIDHLYIDGNRLPQNLPCTAEAIIKGDSKVLEIACASIIAKVFRDKLMEQLANDHPHYGWETNSGYGSKKHLLAIENHGVSIHHRQSFAPVKNAKTAA